MFQGSALLNEAPQETRSDFENSESSQCMPFSYTINIYWDLSGYLHSTHWIVYHFQTVQTIKSESKDMVQPPEEAKTGSGDEREEEEEEEEEDCTVSPAQETAQSSDTASPDTESPVMINTDVCLILLSKHRLFI